jgi:O-antigen ligase
VKFILRWIWPVYAFVFPIIFLPNNTVSDNHLLRICLTAVTVLVGGVLELHLNGFPQQENVLRLMVRHPVPFVALAYGFWTLVSTAFSAQPGVSLTGNLLDYSDGALWTLSLCFVLCLVYTRTHRDRSLEPRLIGAILSSGLVVSVISIAEIVRGKGLFYPWTPENALPVVTFPGPGHLAGFLILCGALAVAWWFRSAQVRVWIWLVVLGTSFALTLTNRRAALPALGVSLLVGLKEPVRMIVIAIAVSAGLLGGQQFMNRTAEHSVRSIGDSTSLQTRSYLWKAAVNGIAARPIIGWGGSGFQYVWHHYLPSAEVGKYISLEFGVEVKRIARVFETPGGDQWFILENNKGQKKPITINFWKAHNQLLDVALNWGVVGLALYALMVVLTFRSFYLPGIVALACYQLYLLLWYVPLDVESLVFLLVGFSAAMGYQPLRESTRISTPASVQI